MKKMKEYIKSNTKWMYILMVISILAMPFTSCNEDTDEASGPPTITSVRKTTNTDSTFTGTFPNEMIVIQGENLKGTRHLYFNNVEIGFNPNYVTNTTLIATIPEDLPLKGVNPDLPNEIRLETPKGEARFSFKFYSPEPVIDLLLFTIPAEAGGNLIIFGSNFYEVEKIIFESNEGNVETTQFTVSEDYKVISLKIPQGVANEGAIEIVCVSGSVSKEFIPKPTQVFRSISSDMPIVGDKVTIFGEYIYDIQKIVMQNNIEITDFTINSTNSELSFTMPANTPIQRGLLQVVTSDNTFVVTDSFYPEEYVMANFDDQGWYSWGNDNKILTATPDAAPFISTGNCINIFGTPGAWNYWWGNIIMGFNEYPAAISSDTPVERLALKFSFYTEFPLDKGYFQVQFGERWDAPATVPEFRPYLDNSGADVGSKPGKWMDYEIPVYLFGPDLKTYGDIRALGTKDVGFYFKNNTDDATLKLNVFVDNIRFVVK
jgi:hypothetical protein